MKNYTELTIYTDGGSRGNPGPAAYGFIITDESQKVIYEEGKTIGVDTNNVAEYSAIVESLRWIEQNAKATKITYFMDSLLA